VDISADSAAHPSWRQPVQTHFRRDGDGWKLVGLRRLADKTTATDAKETSGRR
jgi:hypothetical protein